MKMLSSQKAGTNAVFPVCRSLLPDGLWEKIVRQETGSEPDMIPHRLALQTGKPGVPEYISDLARLESACYSAAQNTSDLSYSATGSVIVNPNLVLLELSWKNLCFLLSPEGNEAVPPEPGPEMVMVWKPPGADKAEARPALPEDLLALKLVVENIDLKDAGLNGEQARTARRTIDQAVLKGILLTPPSKIKRDQVFLAACPETDPQFLEAQVFTLQWHITQACDLHCKHCYDRSERHAVPLSKAFNILKDFRAFCDDRHVWGQISFTGGNPLLHPNFLEIYREASDLGFSLAILGNPTSRQKLDELLSVERPVFYQVSLEGLADRNDAIRGAGHFGRVVDFLEILKESGIFSMVMLTLTKDNIEQVIPLGEFLRDKADLFTFNRLSLVGEGANLAPAERERFSQFLEAYLEASQNNPILQLKDNLFNIIQNRNGLEPFGGCTGFGCGAAFNFLALLADGQVHACRKFPSPLGSILERGIAQIYDSQMANQYRQGSSACSSCAIRAVCGGCLANTFSFGLNIFEDRDPYCFMAPRI